jgi:hypothetical protein
MAMWPSPAVSARPSTGTVEELPWAIFLRDTEGEPTRRYNPRKLAEVFRRLLAACLFVTS